MYHNFTLFVITVHSFYFYLRLTGDQQVLPQQTPTTPTTPATANRVPVPPPGFRSPVVASVAATSVVATAVTTTFDVVTTHTTSVAKNIPERPHNYHQQQHHQQQHHQQQQQQQQKRNSQHFGSHEDPSILWSKVLAGKFFFYQTKLHSK